jgi:acetyl coenzyme A synthetase (ADP forming)-like protein
MRPPQTPVVLRDGGSALLRPLQEGDAPSLKAFFGALGPGSVRQRFFVSRRLGEADLAKLAAPGGEQEGLAVLVREGEGERMLGVAHYVRLQDGSAEFGVAVADAHQGRGIGTLLLEHLGQLARARGIGTLRADVLASNGAMLQLLAASGLEISQTRDDEVVHVRFPTEETARLAHASAMREQAASARSLEPLFAPRAVAVIGASRRPESVGRAIVGNLLRRGYRGRIYPVNPRADQIEGLACYPDVLSIGAPVDLAVIAVPAPQVEAAVLDCARSAVRCVVVISSGFAEAGGREAQERLVALVRGCGMRMVGPNCLGVLSTAPDVSLDATFSPGWPPVGTVSFLSQSGALGIAILEHAARNGIGLADFVSVGNRADVSSNDLLAYWGQSERTAVIALYLESIGNPRKFARIAPEVARRKPIVAMKSGRSAAGTRAAASHSASLAGLDVAVDALFAQAGVLRVDTLEQLFDLVALLSCQPLPPGRRVGIVTNAGGPGILFADACEARGLVVPTLEDHTTAELRALLPAQAGLSNPVDLLAQASPEQFRRAIACVGRDAQVDALVAIYVPPMVTRPAEIAAAIAAGAGELSPGKPVAAVFLGQDAPTELDQGPRGRIPCYRFPENAALALAAAVRHTRWLQRPAGAPLALEPAQQRALREQMARVRPDAGGWLPLEQVRTLLEIVGIPFAGFETVPPEPSAAASASERLSGPVVLKVSAPGLVHKTEAGAVALDLRSADAVQLAAERMLERVRSAGHEPTALIVQRQAEGGVEALVGMTTDPDLGPVIVAGLGGIQVELLRDVAFALVPVSDVDAHEMLGRLRLSALLDGFRGAPAADRAALVDCILRVSALVEAAPELLELELNPVRVLQRGLVAVDARARVR